jgi:hypothetical protein
MDLANFVYKCKVISFSATMHSAIEMCFNHLF